MEENVENEKKDINQKNTKEKENEKKDELKEIKVKEERDNSKQDEKKEKLKKIEEREKLEEIVDNEKVVLIKLDENLKKHIETKIFELDDNLIFNYRYLYNKMIRKIILTEVESFYYESFLIIIYDNLSYIFFYKLIPVEFNLIFAEKTENEKKEFSVCSTYEILQYCKNNNYNPYIKINKEKFEYMYMFTFISPEKFINLDKIILVQDNRNYDDYKNERPPSIFPTNNSELEPEKLSKFFELFFKFETKSNFEYWESQKRNNFIIFILKFKSNKLLYCFKICGPSGIGKSMTLFLISKYFKNNLYFNLKTIRILKEDNDNIKIQNILTESCKYLDLNDEQIKELSSLIKKNRSFSFFNNLKKIIEFLIDNKVCSIIILDQFKNNSIDKKEYNDIFVLVKSQKVIIVKLLICSSTNDKDIREECIKSWKEKIFSLEQLNPRNQENYFYIDELCNKIVKGKTKFEKVMHDFNYIPKYKNKFKYLKKEEEDTTQQMKKDLDDIKIKVEKNLKNLYKILNEKDKSEEIITMKMIESLRYLSLYIGENIEYEKLEEFIGICSFKYFTFEFGEIYFIIGYSFPYMNEIINDIIDKHLEEFYKYKLKDQHTGFANADFFELFSGKSLKKKVLILPDSQNTFCLKVKEIVEMKEFSNSKIDTLINKQIYSNLCEFTINKEKLIKEYEEINKEFKERKLLLSLNKIISYDDENIEFHKLQFINELEKEYTIYGNKNIGTLSIFINQKNQRGKTLDLAYVYGPKENKTFIGFQMKAYDEESSHDCKFDSTKSNLKKVLQPMIINIKYLMDMEIKSWHYVVILLLDNKKEEGKKYFKKIVESCKNNGLEYIFYEPFENKFYNRMLEPIKEYIPNQFSNLDNNIENILPINIMDDLDINQYMDNFSNYMINNKLNNIKFIEEGLCFLLNKKRKRNEASFLELKKEEINKGLNDITGNIKIKFGLKSIKFLGAYEFLDSITIPKPKENHFFLTKSKEENNYFIIFNSSFNKNIYYSYNKSLNKNNSGKNNKTTDVICQVDSHFIIANINKKEKFYVFKI